MSLVHALSRCNFVLEVTVLLNKDVHLLPKLIDVLPLNLKILHLQMIVFKAFNRLLLLLIHCLSNVLAASPVPHEAVVNRALSILDLSELGVLVAELRIKGGDLLSQLSDLVDKLHVLLHDVIVVLLVDLGLLLKTLLKRIH